MKKHWIGVLIVLGLAGASGSRGQDLSIRTYVDRNVVGLNEQFTLSIELTGKGANSASDPEIPQIGQFASYLGSGSSQNIQFTNGKMSVTKVTSCYFVATSVGKYKIPPVQVTYNGTPFASAAIDMEVQQSGTKAQSQPQPSAQTQAAAQPGAGPAEGDLFVRAIVDKRQVYQNEPVVVTYKIYTRVNVSNAGISKMPATAGFWTEEFEMSQQQKPVSEVLDGKKYTVATVRRMALFPMSPGSKTIDPLVLDCEVAVRAPRNRDPFGDFFDDSFFFGGRTVRKQIQSKPVTIEVLAFPEAGKPADFAGNTGRFRISASADKRSVKTNEAITYKIAVEGDGNIRQIQAPAVAFPTDFEVYPPKTTETISRSGSGISGRKTFEYVLIPRVAGEETLKPVALGFFDPVSKSYKSVRTESIPLQVAQGSETYTTVAGSGLSKEEVRLIGQDIRFIKMSPPVFRRIGASRIPRGLLGAVLLLPLLALAGAFAYRRRLNRISGDVAYARGIRANSAVRRRLSAAKRLTGVETQKQFYAEAGNALQGYLGDKLNIAEAGMISCEVEKILRGKGAGEEAVSDVFECLSVCDMKRFSPETATVDEMKAFLRKVESAIMRLEKEI
jgi:hypothetical protein